MSLLLLLGQLNLEVAEVVTPVEPTITYYATESITSSSLNIGWITAAPASGTVSYGTDVNSLNQVVNAPTTATTSIVALTGLTPSTTYYYKISAINGALTTITTPNTFKTAALDGTGSIGSSSTPVPPVLNVTYYYVDTITSSTAHIGWTTNWAGVGIVRYGTTPTNLNLTVNASNISINHVVGVIGLATNTTYYFRIDATDGVIFGASPIASFKTAAADNLGGTGTTGGTGGSLGGANSGSGVTVGNGGTTGNSDGTVSTLDPTPIVPTSGLFLPLVNKITIQSSGSATDRVLVAQYGNGFKQVAKDGFNSLVRKWDITYAPLKNILKIGQTVTDFATVNNFMEQVATDTWFYWKPLGSSYYYKWRRVANTYKVTPLSTSTFQISFSIEQAFDLD